MDRFASRFSSRSINIIIILLLSIIVLPSGTYACNKSMSVDFSRENLSSLMKDGVTEDLFKLLWAKDELNFSPMINVPDTIIYKYGQPVTWYFTSVNGHVKKKNKSNLISAKIEETFTKHVLGYDVLAYFISMPSDHESQGKTSNNDFQTIVEYFDRDGLKSFLYNHRKEVNGILQRFIEPKSTHNEMIRGIWSPKLCLLERAENIHALHDARYGLYEKCVIYEGPDYYYTSAPLRGPVLSGQIQKLCEATVSHIAEVTFGQKQVSRLVLNFKVDSRDKIWLLYSTSIRTIDMLEYNPLDSLNGTIRNLVNIDSVVSLAETVHLNPKKQYSKIKPRIRIPCLSCGKEELEEMRHPVTYKSIIKHYDHILHLMKLASTSMSKRKAKTLDGKDDIVVKWPPDDELVDSAGGVGFGCVNADEDRSKKHQKLKYLKDLQIPPVIGALHPKLVTETYVRCKDDPLFLNKTVHVCEACYLVFAEFQTMLLQLGGNLTKLLTPDPAAGTIAVVPKSQTANRPTSADWRAISSTMSHGNRSLSAESGSLTTMSRSALQHQDEAKSRAIGLRSSDTRLQPEVPEGIRSPHHAHELNEFTFSTINTNEVPYTSYGNSNSSIRSGSANGSLYRGGLLENDGNSVATSTVYDPQDVQAMIADRERRFFKEISLNPQLKDQHPLMHIISAQQKLKLVDQQSGVLMSKAASESASVFGSKYGKQPGDKYDRLGPYNSELPYIVNGEVILPSQLKARKKQQAIDKKEARQRSIRSFLQGEDDGNSAAGTSTIASAAQSAVTAVNNSTSSSPVKDVGGTAAPSKPGTANTIADNNIKSSKKYRDFLSESLKKIQSDVEGAAPFRRTNFINNEVDENGITIESVPSTADSKISKRGKGGKDSSEKSAQSTVPISQKSNHTVPIASGPGPALPSKKRLEGEPVSSRDYHLDYNFDDAPVFPTGTSSQSSAIPKDPQSEEGSPPLGNASKPLVGSSTKGGIQKENSFKTGIMKSSSGKLPASSLQDNSKEGPSDKTPVSNGSPIDVNQSHNSDKNVSHPRPPHTDNDEESLLSPLPKFVPGQLLEEDSSLLITNSVDKINDPYVSATNGDAASEGDGFSVSHSEAFVGLNDDHQSIASLDSLGNSLEALSNADLGDGSMLISPEYINKSQLRANISKTLASEESLIKEQTDALLQMSGSTSIHNNEVDV